MTNASLGRIDLPTTTVERPDFAEYAAQLFIQALINSHLDYSSALQTVCPTAWSLRSHTSPLMLSKIGLQQSFHTHSNSDIIIAQWV